MRWCWGWCPGCGGGGRFEVGGFGFGLRVLVFCRSELAREQSYLIALELGLIPLPLPNPLPEGRGDRSVCLGVLESAGNTEGFRLKPFPLSARTSPLSLQGEGWGEGTESTQSTTTAG
ncbi:hypothetical protein Pssp01_39670 [Pseudomonas sp. NBRC 100443]|nr:hypothetical protein Pssp01_39670 [Pseudomonas sp. NBRC 100443]